MKILNLNLEIFDTDISILIWKHQNYNIFRNNILK